MLIGAFNQDKALVALVGRVILLYCKTFVSSYSPSTSTSQDLFCRMLRIFGFGLFLRSQDRARIKDNKNKSNFDYTSVSINSYTSVSTDVSLLLSCVYIWSR